MSQFIPTDINPATTSGTDLADNILDPYFLAYATSQSGTTRPTNIGVGGVWLDITNDPTEWTLRMYDGTDDVPLLIIDPVNNTASAASGGALLQLEKISDDAIGPILQFIKKRLAGTGQTENGDVLGEIKFNGQDSTSTERTQARIYNQTTEDTEVTNLGSFIALELATTGTGSLVEILRIIDGNLGFGVTSPDSKFHVKGGDTTVEREEDLTTAPKVILHKKRLASGGQVLSGDGVGSLQTLSRDQASTDFTAASIDAVAEENHTDTARGTSISVKTIGNGTTTLSERLKIDETGLTVQGNISATGSVGGNINSFNTEINQVAHGFSVGDVVTHNGTIYVAAISDGTDLAAFFGIVSSVADVDNFTYSQGYTIGLSGLTPGSVYYLSETVAGDITTTAPSSQTPVLKAVTATEAYVFSYSKSSASQTLAGPQTISASGNLTITKTPRQRIKVISDGGEVLTSTQPFGSTTALFEDGMIVTVVGTSNTDVVNLAVDENVQYGIWADQEIKMINGKRAVFEYDEGEERFVLLYVNTTFNG